jgi:hypothetical protein
VSVTTKLSSPLVIPGVPVQPESVPFAESVWVAVTVGEIGGDKVSVPANFVQVNTAAAPGAEVVVSSGAFVVEELLGEELLEHAGSNAAIAINIAVTTRCLRTRATSVPANMGRAPYRATGHRPMSPAARCGLFSRRPKEQP